MQEEIGNLDDIIEIVANLDPVFFEKHLRNFNVQDFAERVLDKEFLDKKYEITVDTKANEFFVMIYSTVSANTESGSGPVGDMFMVISLMFLSFMVTELQSRNNVF